MAHWIIEDKGFGGCVYTCSECREFWNDLFYNVSSITEKCPNCAAEMNEDLTEYIENTKTIKNTMKKFNINDMIKVKLTAIGKDIYYHQYDELNRHSGRIVFEPKYPEVDADGYSRFQLWHLMALYGPHLFNGCKVPFEGNNIYFENELLEDV